LSTEAAVYSVACLALAFWISLRLIHIIALFYGWYRLHRKRGLSPPEERPLPGVSILKPLIDSVDPSLFQNLETFFTLDYPRYEVIFCVQEADDDRLKMFIDSLCSKYPKVDAQAFYGGEAVGVNPKVNNMQPGYAAAKYELVLVSDSGIRMQEDTLTDMVACMGEGVGLVHQMPYAYDRPGIPATLEKVYFGTSHARIYLTASFLGVNCATGMSALMRKDVLDKAGGIKAFGKYLAEDYFMAQKFHDEGYSIVISSQPALQNAGDSSVVIFQNRITRWTKLRSAMCPHTILLEPLSECMLLGCLTAWAVDFLFRWDPVTFFLVHVLLWFIMDWLLLLIVQNGSLPFNRFEFLVTWLFREISAPYLFFLAQLNPAIQWRSKYFRLRWGGLVEPLGEKSAVL
jgi:ceramide glucosyltransferase